MTYSKWLVPERYNQEELLDQGYGTLEDVTENLAELDRINRFLGGFRALTQHLLPRLQRLGRPAVLLDLGTGSARLPHIVTQWAQQRQLPVQVLGLDAMHRHLRIASASLNGAPGVTLLQGDVHHLPLAPDSVDYVFSTLVLHHFDPEQVVGILRRANEVARSGVIMSDLTRGWLPWVGFRIAQPLFARHPITLHDGLASIRRAYTPDEMRDMATAAGLRSGRVHTHFPFRMTLVADQ